jgi:hypothetical protein
MTHPHHHCHHDDNGAEIVEPPKCKPEDAPTSKYREQYGVIVICKDNVGFVQGFWAGLIGRCVCVASSIFSDKSNSFSTSHCAFKSSSSVRSDSLRG